MVKSTVLLDFSLKKNISEATLLVFAGSPTTSCLRDPLQVHRPSVFGSIPSSGSLLCVTVAPQVLLYACAVVAGVEFADFGTGVYHFSVDNYGSAQTPIVGSQIEAFQGHHEEPWTITYRDFCNNCFPTCIATMPFLLGFELFCPSPVVLLWAIVACAGIAFCQEFHKWSHTLRSQCHPVINWLQDRGILVHRSAHLRHHKPPFETNYCIVTGHMNPILDRRSRRKNAVRRGWKVDMKCRFRDEGEIER
ncbi:Fatty acid desaturase 4-like 1 [Durusdinium trenchii]|uniref:Chloroplastic (FAD4-L1) n=1 Tax=Durusdinium trenchii TaxID=1381693 RepID=A0ABP0LDL2_9DINO